MLSYFTGAIFETALPSGLQTRAHLYEVDQMSRNGGHVVFVASFDASLLSGLKRKQ